MPASLPGRQPILVGTVFFLFITADAFCIPFLPILADALYDPASLLPRDLAVGLPISAFWLTVAVAQLSTARWERGRDRRMLFIVWMGVCAAGLAAAGLSRSVEMLIAARAISGFGYGAVMILTQDYLLRALGAQARTLASGLYLSLFFAGALAGTLAGSSLADRVGFGTTLLSAAALASVAAAAMVALKRHREELPPQRFRLGEVVANRRLVALVLFAAFPSRLINGGFVFFFAPLYLHGIGADAATIGKVVLIYSLIMATTALPWSRLVDRTGAPVAFTVLGVALSGLAMLIVPLALQGLWGAVAAMAILGTAQAIGMSPQITVLFKIAGREVEQFGQTSILGLYRVCERLGLVCGPLVAGWLLGWAGPDEALLVLGGTMLASALILYAILAGTDGRRTSPTGGGAG